MEKLSLITAVIFGIVGSMIQCVWLYELGYLLLLTAFITWLSKQIKSKSI